MSNPTLSQKPQSEVDVQTAPPFAVCPEALAELLVVHLLRVDLPCISRTE